jgi:hypothetical protein
MEIFKDIVGYEGLYQVSNMGRIKSIIYANEVILKSHENKGYLQVSLTKNKKRKPQRVHQLIAMTFLNHTPCGHDLVVDHIDSNKTNNKLDNLQIVTNRFNSYKTQGKYSSKYKGVSWNKRTGNWRSRIMINGKDICLGYFKKEYDAYIAYQNKLLSLSN